LKNELGWGVYSLVGVLLFNKVSKREKIILVKLGG